MTARRRGVAFTPMETRRDVIVRAARLADELGYETVSLPEGWGLDSTPVLTEIALRTRQIKLASGVLSVWGRTPATLAMTAATLHQISGGRFVLGLGASTRALVEGFHDTAFEHPAAKLRDVVTRVRALLAGEPAHLDGVPRARPLRLGQPPAPELPIWLAAMGDRTLRVAAGLGDGWFPVMVARDRLAGWARRLERLREAAGRLAQAQVVLDQLTAYGTPGQVRDRLESWDGVVDVVMVGLPPGLSWETIEATLRTVAPGPGPLPGQPGHDRRLE